MPAFLNILWFVGFLWSIWLVFEFIGGHLIEESEIEQFGDLLTDL